MGLLGVEQSQRDEERNTDIEVFIFPYTDTPFSFFLQNVDVLSL